MPNEKINVLSTVGTLQELSNSVAQLQRLLKYLLDGNLDFENIRVGGIIADNISVEKLSALSADLGEITAGIINGIEIYGSYISTNPTGYPKTEMSVAGNFLKVSLTATEFIEVIKQSTGGFPAIQVKVGNDYMIMGYGLGGLGLPAIISNDPIYMSTIECNGDFNGLTWNNFVNYFAGRTLQQELDDIWSAIGTINSSLSGKADSGSSTSSAGGHNHGIAPGTELVTTTGTVVWSSAPNHSHTQV